MLEAKKSRGIPDYEIVPSERRGRWHGWTTKGLRNICREFDDTFGEGTIISVDHVPHEMVQRT